MEVELQDGSGIARWKLNSNMEMELQDGNGIARWK
jgi:hypothetical protein